MEWDAASADFFNGMHKGLTDLEFGLRPQIEQIGVFSAKGAKSKFANVLDAAMGQVFNENIDAFNSRIAADGVVTEQRMTYANYRINFLHPIFIVQ